MHIQYLKANGVNANGMLWLVEIWEFKCEGAIFSVFGIFSNDYSNPSTNPKCPSPPQPDLNRPSWCLTWSYLIIEPWISVNVELKRAISTSWGSENRTQCPPGRHFSFTFLYIDPQKLYYTRVTIRPGFMRCVPVSRRLVQKCKIVPVFHM